ncbi:MAG: hypothetical protein ABSF24_09640 [Candidatus Bathyarchaeia archaeon]
MSTRELFLSLYRKKKLPSKDFLELYDLIWEGTAPIKYQNPENWRAHRGDEK